MASEFQSKLEPGIVAHAGRIAGEGAGRIVLIEIKADEFGDIDGDGRAVVVNEAICEFRIGEVLSRHVVELEGKAGEIVTGHR